MYLDSGLLVNGLFLLSNLLLLLVDIVRNINLNSKLVTKFVDAGTLRADNSANIFLVDIEFRGLTKPSKDVIKFTTLKTLT